MKTCKSCHALLPLSEFGSHRGKADGLQPWCRPCTNRSNALWIERNQDRHAATLAARRVINAEPLRAYKAAWYQANKERIGEGNGYGTKRVV